MANNEYPIKKIVIGDRTNTFKIAANAEDIYYDKKDGTFSSVQKAIENLNAFFN